MCVCVQICVCKSECVSVCLYIYIYNGQSLTETFWTGASSWKNQVIRWIWPLKQKVEGGEMQNMIREIEEKRKRRRTIYVYNTVEEAGEERLSKDTVIRVSWAKRRTTTSLAWHIKDSSAVLCGHRGHPPNYTFTDITQVHARMHTHPNRSFNSSSPFLPDETWMQISYTLLGRGAKRY